jgi:hypothetical protein
MRRSWGNTVRRPAVPGVREVQVALAVLPEVRPLPVPSGLLRCQIRNRGKSALHKPTDLRIADKQDLVQQILQQALPPAVHLKPRQQLPLQIRHPPAFLHLPLPLLYRIRIADKTVLHR